MLETRKWLVQQCCSSMIHIVVYIFFNPDDCIKLGRGWFFHETAYKSHVSFSFCCHIPSYQLCSTSQPLLNGLNYCLRFPLTLRLTIYSRALVIAERIPGKIYGNFHYCSREFVFGKFWKFSHYIGGSPGFEFLPRAQSPQLDWVRVVLTYKPRIVWHWVLIGSLFKRHTN